jgi:hypothetical protein
MRSDQRRISDSICDRLLECICFSPVSESDSYTSGIYQSGLGFGGLGYSYWTSYHALALHKMLPSIRKASSRDISLNEAKELVKEFCGLHIVPLIAGQFHLQTGRGSLSNHLNDAQKQILKNEFSSCLFEFTREKWHWMPLNSVVGTGYKGKDLILADIPEASEITHLEMSTFLHKPLFENAKKYAGLKARNTEHAVEKLGILLGTLFLCMHAGTHHSHTMGTPTSGVLFFEDGMTIYSSAAHLPCLATELELTEADFPLFLKIEQLLRGDEADRKLNRSLRWLSASWFAKGAERFSLICQAIDALTPSSLNTMRAKCHWIREQLNGAVAQEPIELLFKSIRSDIVHGDAPSLIESTKYLEFLSRYDIEPGFAALEIVRKILVEKFIPCVSIRPDPIVAYPDLIEQQRAVFARYGMEFKFSTGFEFSKLSR